MATEDDVDPEAYAVEMAGAWLESFEHQVATNDSGLRFWDPNGAEISLREWLRLLSEDTRLAFDYSNEPDHQWTVSTVWVGVSHDGRYIFESLVFGSKLDGEGYRYSTRAEALDNHQALVTLVRAEHEFESP